MRKKYASISIVLLIILSLSICLFACNDSNKQTLNDDDYTLELKGLVDAEGNTLENFVINKGQIKKFYNENEDKRVIYTKSNPCFASDKTDDDGNLIPHSLKGVYLEDIMAHFTDSAPIAEYGSLTIDACDGYVTTATEEIFNSAGRGSKMIIAFEYDDEVLNNSSKSGALRAVFPDQIANVWAKKIKTIEFSTDILVSPTINKFTIFEALPDTFSADYTIQEAQNNINFNKTYFGISIAKLLLDPTILNATSTDKMYLTAWDYNSDTNKGTEYSVWTKYDVYSNGYLLTHSQREDEPKEELERKPVFDGPTFNSGMTVKNILAIEVYKTAIVSLDTAMLRFDADNNGDTDGKFNASDLLNILNMWDDDNIYSITSTSGDTIDVPYDAMLSAKISKDDLNNYVLSYGDKKTITLKSVAIKIN